MSERRECKEVFQVRRNGVGLPSFAVLMPILYAKDLGGSNVSRYGSSESAIYEINFSRVPGKPLDF